MKAAKKLSGPSLNRFFKRFFQAQPGIDAQTAERLTDISVRTFSSVRIRRIVWRQVHGSAQRRSVRRAPEATAANPAPATAPDSEPENVMPAALEQAPVAAFDPYGFGLVPVFQREGRDGLLTKLAGIESTDNLRKMARAQQIALPAELRSGDIALDTLREAIAAAVEKRIANRRAAAG